MKQTTLKMRQRQSGLSLVEMMIGLVLGLIIVSGVFNTYLGSTRSSRFSQGLQDIQENGRYGITTLQRGIRLAGYTPDNDIDAPIDVLNSNNNQIVVKLKDTHDCNGQPTTGTDGIAINIYAHDPLNNAITCEGNVGQDPMEIVEGVDAVRFLWGISTDGDEVPEQYIPYSAAINPSEVVAMRVAILVSSSDSIRSRATEETHVLFDEEVVISPADKIARNVFTTTVKLRNKPKL